MRSSKYVPFVPLHISWQPTPFFSALHRSCGVLSLRCSRAEWRLALVGHSSRRVLCEFGIKYVWCRDWPDAITFSNSVTEMHETTCFVLQVKKPSSLPTVLDQTDIVMWRRSAKLEALAFDSEVTSHRSAIGRDTTATPCG